MSYETDDLKPMRPRKASSPENGDAPESRAAIQPPEAVPDSERGKQSEDARCRKRDTGDPRLATADTRNEPATRAEGPEVHALRAGDDDVRPCRPPEAVLKRRQKLSAQPNNTCPRTSDPPQRHSDHLRENAGIGGKFGLLRLMAYTCGAIVAIWLLGSLGSVLHSIAIAESIPEMAVFVLIFVIEVSVVWYVIYYARKTFAEFPEVTQLHREDYSGSLQTLTTKLRSDYIRRFPEPERYAALAGFEQGDAALHMLARLRDHKYADSAGFMDEYERFQRALDERALEIIKKYAKIIGIKTAASPWKIVDIFAVFFNSTLMVCNIANVYYRQMSRQEAFRLVIRWFINLYISGELGQVTEGAADAISRGTADWLGNEGISAVLRPAVPLLAKFGGKIAEGGVNAYLAYRLGCRASEYFRELVD